MTASEIARKAETDFAELSRMPVNGVTGLAKTDDGWVVSLEAVEKKSIPDTMDVLGLYEVRMEREGNLLGFERKKLRRRGETGDN